MTDKDYTQSNSGRISITNLKTYDIVMNPGFSNTKMIFPSRNFKRKLKIKKIFNEFC
jgi:hypothetical protein